MILQLLSHYINVVMNMYGGIIRAVTDDSSLFCEKGTSNLEAGGIP